MASNPKQKYQLAERSTWAKIWHWLIADPWRKLIALTLAFCIWGVLSLNLNRTGNRRWGAVDHVPLQFLSRPDGSGHHFYLESQSISPREISLLVSVDAWSDAQLIAENFQVRIQPHPERLVFSNDGMRTQPMETVYTLQETDLVEKPDGVTLRGFTPPTITFKWDRLTSKEVPVNLVINNQLPEHLAYQEPEPPAVSVIGPAFLVNQISSIDTVPIRLDQQSPTTVTINSHLQLPSQFRGLALSQDSITASFEIVDSQRPLAKFLKDIHLGYLTSPENSLILQNVQELPRTVSIYVDGPAGLLESLDSTQLMAICDLTGYSMPGPQNVPIRIQNLPSGLHITTISPQTTRVVLVPPDTP